MRTLADGRLSEVEPRLGQLRRVDPLVAEVARADAAARAATAGLAELRELQQRVEHEAPDRPLLRWWVLSMLGERAWLDTDLGVIPLAVQVLHELPDEPFATLPLLYVRGRLRRIASAAYLVTPAPDGLAHHARLRDMAVADFRRAGLTAEVALTRGLSAAVHAIATWDDLIEDLELVRDARVLLGDIGESIWLPVLDQLHALVALAIGDLAEAGAALAAVERRGHLHPVFTAFADAGRAEIDLVESGGSDASVAAMLAALDRLRAGHPQLLGLTQQRLANLLADVGRAEEARAVGLAGLAWPPPNSLMAVSGALLRVRLGVLDGVTRDAEAALPLLEQLADQGHVRRAGAVALRMARDLARVEAPDAAATLRTWGLARLPDDRHRTAWERRWAAPLDISPPATPHAATPHAATPHAAAGDADLGAGGAVGAGGVDISVKVMVPVLEVARAGVTVPLRTMPAKLLLALLAAHPEPLHVEGVVDLLWPGAAPEVGRPRLNTVVHRLRRSLDLPPRALRRVGDVLLLDPAGWDVDLFRFRARPDTVVDEVTGNLCHIQFPYDDLLVAQRHVLDAQIASARRRDA